MFSGFIPVFLSLSLLKPVVASNCPTTSVANIPGCWDEPSCAYVIAGDDQACKFDHCNCGGIAAPLLPSTIDGTPTLGCGSYTTKPTADSCPTEEAILPSGSGNDGDGGTPEQVTAGGPISTVTDAFKTDTNAPTVTTFSYQGGALTYTRATFTSFTEQTGTATITATVTKTRGGDNSVQTYVGPIIVGPHGLFWGPPGTASHCVWPFCMESGPPPGGTSVGGGDGKVGGGGGDAFSCQDCVGGGGGTNGQGGGSGGDGGKDDDGGDESKPPPDCSLGKKFKRQPSFSSLTDRLAKRTEEILVSTNPLKTALANFGSDRANNNLAFSAIDTAEEIILNKFPKEEKNAYITGLEGHYTLPRRMTVGTGENAQNFLPNTRIFWRIRWDWDPAKGPHVNAQFGAKPSSKFAYRLDPRLYPGGRSRRAMDRIENIVNRQCGYSKARGIGREPPAWKTTKEQALADLKNYFKTEVNGLDVMAL